MLNWRRSVVVHRVTYKQLFAARRCSCAWLVSVFLWILALGVPFSLAFCVNGWWFSKSLAASTVAEKPRLLAVRPAYASLSLTAVEKRKHASPTSQLTEKATFQESSQRTQRHPSDTQQQLRRQQKQYPENKEEGILIVFGKVEWTPSSAGQHLSWSAERQAFVKNEENLNGTNDIAKPNINASVAASGDSIRVDLDWPLILNGEKNWNALHDENYVHPKVTQCEVGLQLFYELPSAPNVVFDGLAVVSVQSAVPASGLLLRGNLLLRQEAAVDMAAEETLPRTASNGLISFNDERPVDARLEHEQR